MPRDQGDPRTLNETRGTRARMIQGESRESQYRQHCREMLEIRGVGLREQMGAKRHAGNESRKGNESQ